MRHSLPDERMTGRPSRVGKGRKATRRRRPHIRCNSVCAPSCQREASVGATMDLCNLYRLSVVEPNLPLIETFLKSPNCPIRQELLQTAVLNYQSPLVDLPTKSVRIYGADRWEFDVFSFKRQSSSELVCCLGVHLFEAHDLFHRLCLDRLSVMRALAAIESVYWKRNPYHTALHAVDVTQATHCFISQPKLLRLLNAAEVFGSLLAALCHDADHPGTNQCHLERTGHHLVQLYNGDSVLERHHARVGLTILHGSGLAKCLNSADWMTVRDCILQMVHATDMAHQGYFKTKFTKLVDAKLAQPSLPYSSSDRMLLLQISLKCADISNPCRPWDACRQWAHRICAEFFSQGDQERLRWSMTPTRGCDRNGSVIPAIQVAFIDNLIRPLFSKLHEFFQTDLTNVIMHNLDENYKQWQDQLHTVVPPEVVKRSSSLYHSPVVSPARVDKKPRKALKDRLITTKQMTVSKIAKTQPHNVTFDLATNTAAGQDCTRTKELECVPKTKLQTFFITTRGIRRHSLPETQGAIKKTFNFALSKKQNLPNLNDTQSGGAFCCSTVKNGPPSSIHYLYINRPTIKSLRTPSGNILQTLCEEIISHEPSSEKSRALRLDPFPLPDAWTVTTTTAGVRGSGASTDATDCFEYLDILALRPSDRAAGSALFVEGVRNPGRYAATAHI
ncbi:high affinity cAMP-specific 3',5'-cyclic phosphodiesterase 7 [Paragonimus westermani]|uniref:High affinity cAMP-specific 3',5'-cyclic phosphodiesterase 7 n=1 Tax=Paragonimus westermani TaxID=34504 RepID=A0A5J4NR65_9TREM|nr:high affinity cAMP-specific 3',5'-cyclic phosphodiesterase 7 [Paragonimus westermani]